jgi:hypothetical protein
MCLVRGSQDVGHIVSFFFLVFGLEASGMGLLPREIFLLDAGWGWWLAMGV